MKFHITYKSEDNYDPTPPMPPHFIGIDADNDNDLRQQILSNSPSTRHTIAIVSAEMVVSLDEIKSKD